MNEKKHVGLTRTKADALLPVLLERVAVVNADPQYILGISRMVVFGSYLSDKNKLGDLDVAIQIGPKNRIPEAHETLRREQIKTEGRGNILERWNWPKEKVLRALRGRNYAFSIHGYDEFQAMVEAGVAHGRELYRNDAYDPM